MKNKKYISGISLPVTVILSFAGMGIVFSYYNSLFNEFWIIEYQIAETKAGYMADTGIAESRKYMIDIDFDIFCDATEGDTYHQKSGRIQSMNETGVEMGSYTVQYCLDPEVFAPRAMSIGKATVKNVYGKKITLEKTKYITFAPGQALNDYLYLTNSERAGGAPYVFDGYPSFNNRREVNFSTGDAFNSQWPNDEPVCDVGFQTNGQFVMSDFGCPSFETTVTVTKDENGEVNFPDMGSCNENQVFQGDPPLDTLEVICLSSDDDFKEKREYVKSHPMVHKYIDATQKMNHTPTYFTRDTLIMTDIEFITENGGGIKVKQWWYLMPPYLNTDGLEMPFVFSSAMNAPGDPCIAPNLYQCDKYIESMENFHAKSVTSNGFDTFLDPIVQSTFGFHHYDVKDIYASFGNNWVSQFNDAHLLPEYELDGYKIYYFSRPTAIYVEGGPVRVHGTYKGRYTVMTDEYVTYNRHAWGTNLQASAGGPRLDTLWTNIWITDDLTNSDASWNGNLLSAQPDENCEGGSENILGLVSGANVYIANTQANGARNNFWGQDINIHAHIIAFNESFAVQYWQNTISNPAYCSDPPYGDAQGEDIYNGSTGGNDYRGNIYLWGGVVQKYRGYMKRNNPGPYPTGPIGMDKVYNFDCNLKCSDPPPLYPDKREGSCDEEEKKKIIQ